MGTCDPYVNPKQRAWLARTHVERIKKWARFVLFVDGEGKFVSAKENNPEAMNVFAVVGPVSNRGITLEEAPLLEVGIHRGRPYNSTFRRIDGIGRVECRPRRHYLSYLPTHQVWEIWKEVVAMMERHASLFLKDHDMKAFSNKSIPRISRGVTYSVALQDTPILASVLQTELQHKANPLQEDMEKAAKHLDKLLQRYDDLEFVPEHELEKEMQKVKHDALNDAIRFLERRALLPHQLFLLCRNMEKKVNSHGIFMRLLRRYLSREVTSWEEIEEWGKLLFLPDVPVPHGSYVFCKKRLLTKNRNGTVRKGTTKQGRFLEYMQFFVTPKQMVDQEYGSLLEEERQFFPPVIPNPDLPDHNVPF